MWPCIPFFLLALSFAVQTAHAFPFTHTAPTECGDMTVTWEGGSPPFRLLIIPNGHTLRNLSIPPDSFDGTTGSFTTPMPWTAGTQMVLAMSDSTGRTAGGITPLLTLGGLEPGARACDTTTQVADFFYSLDGTLQQCVDFPFTNYGRATRPVSLYGFVPNGRHFAIEGIQEETFNWRADEPAGTSVLFFLTDALGRNGGVVLRSVGASEDSGCLPLAQPSSSSPSSTASSTYRSAPNLPPTSSTNQTPAPSGGANGDTGGEEEKKGGSNVGLIVGAAAGGFVALGIFAFIAVFCFQRKKKNVGPNGEVKIDIDGPPGPFTSPSNTYLLPSSYNGSKANLAPSQSAAPYAQESFNSSASYAAANSSPHARPPHHATTPSVTVPPSEYNPYSDTGAYGHSSQNSTSNASAVSPYDGMNNGQSTAGYPPSSGYGGLATGAGAYGAYSQYQQHQHYAPSSQHNYNVGPQGLLYATNADPPSTPYTSTAGGSKPARYSQGSTEKRGYPPQPPPQRLVQHQDIDEAMDLPDELPPQYSESRAPIPGLPSSYTAGSQNPNRKS